LFVSIDASLSVHVELINAHPVSHGCFVFGKSTVVVVDVSDGVVVVEVGGVTEILVRIIVSLRHFA
jgi:hypothetical protein